MSATTTIKILTPEAVVQMRANWAEIQGKLTQGLGELIIREILPPLIASQMQTYDTLLATIEDRERQVRELEAQLEAASTGLRVLKGGNDGTAQ